MDTIQQIAAILSEAEKVAYKRGWDDAVAQIVKAVQTPSATGMTQSTLPFVQSNRQSASDGLTIIDMVKSYVGSHPGSRGVEIVEFVANQQPDKERSSVDRSVRTALMRLKKRTQVYSLKGRWYRDLQEAMNHNTPGFGGV